MQCRDAQALMTASLVGEVHPEERREFEGHVAACPSCQEELTSLRQVWDRLGQWPIPALEPRLEHDLLARVGREVATRRPRLGLVPATAAALVAALLSIGASVVLPYERAFELCRQRLQGIGVLAGLPDSSLFFLASLFYGVIPLLLAGVMLVRVTGGGAPLSQGMTTGAVFALFMTPYVLFVCSALPGALIAAILAGVGLGGLFGALGGCWLGARRWRPAH